MTASVTSERPGKRDRLIAGARETIHRQGVEATTIADIAEASDVPLGNVYYYFKSKEALAEAVIAAHEHALRARFASWDAAHRDPRAVMRAHAGATAGWRAESLAEIAAGDREVADEIGRYVGARERRGQRDERGCCGDFEECSWCFARGWNWWTGDGWRGCIGDCLVGGWS